MATLDDVRALALALPGTDEHASRGAATWRVRGKGFVWERPLRAADRDALGSAAPDGLVLGVAVADLGVKEALLASDADAVFTTPHVDGYAAVLVRLDDIDLVRLEELVVEAWLVKAPQRVAAAWWADRAGT